MIYSTSESKARRSKVWSAIEEYLRKEVHKDAVLLGVSFRANYETTTLKPYGSQTIRKVIETDDGKVELDTDHGRLTLKK